MTSRTHPGRFVERDSPSRNRLGQETSPYLLQHRNNPVDWYPWGPEAFQVARDADKPIFLSVGYSTCYWCHVMERESFESEATAAIMNEHFVCIKVDREERPDVDDIYMMAVNVLNQGQGGWPMSVFMEPHGLEPFLAGTYYPPEDGHGRPGFKSVLTQIANFWTTQRTGVEKQADEVARLVTEQLSRLAPSMPIGRDQVEIGISQLLQNYDPTHGGFGRHRKFPVPSNLDFLMDAAWDRPEVRDAVLYTLDRMATGGLYDQIGGGFHRYTVDEKWLVPHFEKMLYDNGQLLSTYAEAYERTGDAFYAEILRETMRYIQREMTSGDGAFFSAQDAEVNHREGENYLWVIDQMRDALTDAGLADDVEFALHVYGLDGGTNFQDPHHPEDGPKNVVHLVMRPDALAERLSMSMDAFNARIKRVNTALLAVRDRRDQPITDDKILTAWNGLMIGGLADAGRVLASVDPSTSETALAAARRAARTILGRMRSPDDPDGLLRTAREDQAKIDAFLEDYAYMIHGLLRLHRATGEDEWLTAATGLVRAADERFWDPINGAWYDTLPEQSDLFVRVKSTYDGAVPSGNGVMVNNLLDRHEATDDGAESEWLDRAEAGVRSLSGVMARQPTGSVASLRALHRMVERYPDRLEKSAPPDAGPPRPVTISVNRPTIVFGADAEQTFEVTLTVADGYHLNAHRPGIEYLIPLEIAIADARGLTVEIEYPPGEQYNGPEGAMLVHQGSVTIPVRLRWDGTPIDEPRVLVTYQVCTDEVCLAPETAVVPVRVSS